MKYFYREKVDLDEIDLNDRTFLFSFPRRDIFLLESIKKFGVLQPPILTQTKDSKFQIISGEGRIWASYNLNLTSIPCIIIQNHNPKDLLIISLETNLSRNLNLVEKAEFLKKALPYFEKTELLNLLTKLGLPSNYNHIKFLLKISNLSNEFKNLLIQDRLNPFLVEFLEDFSEEEKKEFLEILEKLRLTFSEQREVLEKLLDYKKRTDLPQLLPEELKEILKEENFNKRKQQFFEKLQELYLPNFSAKRNLIQPLLKDLQKKGLSLKYHPYFEKKEIEISLKITNIVNLEEKLKIVQQNREKLKKILEII